MDITIYAERVLEKERTLRWSCLQDLSPLSDKQLDLAQCLQLINNFCCYFDALREVIQKHVDLFGEREQSKAQSIFAQRDFAIQSIKDSIHSYFISSSNTSFNEYAKQCLLEDLTTKVWAHYETELLLYLGDKDIPMLQSRSAE